MSAALRLPVIVKTASGPGSNSVSPASKYGDKLTRHLKEKFTQIGEGAFRYRMLCPRTKNVNDWKAAVLSCLPEDPHYFFTITLEKGSLLLHIKPQKAPPPSPQTSPQNPSADQSPGSGPAAGPLQSIPEVVPKAAPIIGPAPANSEADPLYSKHLNAWLDCGFTKLYDHFYRYSHDCPEGDTLESWQEVLSEAAPHDKNYDLQFSAQEGGIYVLLLKKRASS